MQSVPSGAPTDLSALSAFDEHRGLLFSIAYRMLGSSADAEDLLQETFLRWRQAKETAARDPRAFLVTVITSLCANQQQSARVRREQYFGQWLHTPILGSVVLASATAWVVLRMLLGNHPLFQVPQYELVHPLEFAIYAALGVIGGIVSVVAMVIRSVTASGFDAKG
jgi:RNA polymerase sigma-70 factor, ECF subfamily